MIIGTGVRSYEAGEVWHLLDQRVGMPISKIPVRNFNRVNLDDYSTMVIVSGNYNFNESQINKIKNWASRGNTIVSIGSGSKFLIDSNIVDEELYEHEESDNMNKFKPYIDAQDNIGKEQIGGIILNAQLDMSHPLSFGYEDPIVPVYKNNTVWLKPSKNEYSSVVRYTPNPLIDGFVTKNNLSLIHI